MLTDPRITKPIARLTAICELAETFNDPLTRAGHTVRSKPTSRPPGETQCDATVRDLERLLCAAVRDAERVLARANPRQPRPDVVVRVGGIVVDNRYGAKVEHLSAKLEGVLE